MTNKPPSIDMNEDQILQIGNLIGDLWPTGNHTMALSVSGMLVGRGVRLESARSIVARASTKTGGDTEKRLKDVNFVYEAWYRGEPVIGAVEFEAEVMKACPIAFKKDAVSILNKIKKLIGVEKEAEDQDAPNFKIKRLVKFDSRPARWQVTLQLPDGSELGAIVETTHFLRFTLFQDAFMEQNNILLMDLKNKVWNSMIANFQPIEVVQVQNDDHTMIESALNEFLDEAKEKADGGTLRAFAGFEEDCQYFRFAAFDSFLKGSGLKFDRKIVLEALKDLKLENTTKRFGNKTINVWVKKEEAQKVGEEPLTS